VDEGEDYETTVLRETREELGLTLVPSDLTLGPKLLLVEPGFDFFCQFYRYTADVSIDDLTPQKEEIEQLSWFSRDRLRLDLQSDTEKFVITASQWLPQLLGN
jgi:8-oxo-dGTP pyrophosphatase MutT (NUDIX family)